MTAGETIKAAREAKDLTQNELAALADVNVSTVIRAETDRYIPRAPALARLCRVLGITTDDVLKDVE